MFTDTCNGCGVDYTLKPQSEDARLYIFLETVNCNSVAAKCPSCGFVTRLYCNSEDVIRLIQFGLKISVCLEASVEVIAGKAEADAAQQVDHQERYEEWLIEHASDEELRRELGL